MSSRLADKAYDANARVRELLQRKGIHCFIPSKRNHLHPMKHDKVLYEKRRLIENFFCKLKQYRTIATRYNKCVTHFLSGIYRVSSRILLA